MIYVKKRRIDTETIQRFAYVYGFPDDKNLPLFQQINGGIPTGFCVCFDDNGLNKTFVEQILVFDVDDNSELSSAVVIDNFYFDGQGIIPIAVCENGYYICYLEKSPENDIQIFNPDTEIFHTLYTENNESYDSDLFFDELKP